MKLKLKIRPFAAVREKLKEGYTFKDFRADMMAGIIVGLVAIPLGMALAIAVGVPPQYGLYTVIIAGGLVALLGGSRFQVTGPTAAFVVILAPIVQKFDFKGLLVAGFIAGIILIFMGLSGIGQFIRFIPYPVTTGFTSGIAVVIATIQLKDFFGLHTTGSPESYFERVMSLIHARGTWSPLEFAIGATTLAFLILWTKFVKKIPAPLVAMTTVTLGVVLLKKWFPDLEIATIGNRFSYEIGGIAGNGIPQALPKFDWPWAFPGVVPTLAKELPTLDFATVHALLPSAVAIALLGAIESLLSATVADGMAQTKHDPDTELFALGVSNVICPFFGGIAATGAIARTATNIRFGAKSPFSAVVHALFALVVVFLFAPYVSYLPMAALAALLMLVAYNMSEVKHFIHIVKVAPKSDVSVLLICFGLTVIFDMVIGVTFGVILASMLFLKNMASSTSGNILKEGHHVHLKETLPEEIMVYEIAGPLFFGAAERAIEVMDSINDSIRIVIFVMNDVPVIDVTGMVAFESTLQDLRSHERQVFIVGLQNQPLALLTKSRLLTKSKGIQLYPTLDSAIQNAKERITAELATV